MLLLHATEHLHYQGCIPKFYMASINMHNEVFLIVHTSEVKRKCCGRDVN